MVLPYPQKPDCLYVISREQMDDVASLVLHRHCPWCLENHNRTPLLTLADRLGIEVRFTHPAARDVLGMMYMTGEGEDVDCFEYDESGAEVHHQVFATPGTAIIAPDENRRREYFTLAHEISHWILHDGYYSRLEKRAEKGRLMQTHTACREENVFGGAPAGSLRTDEDWMEWQANALASSLLMPKSMFIARARGAIKDARIAGDRPGTAAGADDENCEKERRVIGELALFYGVSRQAVSIRLKRLGILVPLNREFTGKGHAERSI